MPRFALSRRRLLAAAAAATTLPLLPRAAGAAVVERTLTATRGQAPLLGPPRRPTPVWCYDGTVPGPVLRAVQGERLRVVVVNRLDTETTVHWHGLRLPNAMDGVPHLTQPPIAPGERFVYEFDLPDAGTFWYHPHLRSAEQLDRGLAGALIVAERDPIRVDRDVVWVLDDWRLLGGGGVSEDFGSLHDMTHGGRLGNFVTVDGGAGTVLKARAGERVRLRLINVANGRLFRPRFPGLAPLVVALDGQPTPPHPADGLVLGPGMRADLVVDMTGAPGSRVAVVDDFYRDELPLAAIVLDDGPPLRAAPLDAPVALPPNPLPEPDLAAAESLEILLAGGAMSPGPVTGLVAGERMDLREMVRHGLGWTVNGVAAKGHVHQPLFTLRRGATYRIAVVNDTAWHHPMHLHGHAFRVLSRDGRPEPRTPWQDSVLLAPRQRVEVALVADNPGDWMLHCHVLEHQEGGMMAVLRVA